ncbi:CPBP family intramembrane glutamic endopeptidase [Pseudactinotalea terrae]|uniref:CPBP family intramembrane glutamic endopeptidase n=1 Tax=Pseudactinotalea terrae TaxID=1743262 RepID=UPI0012E24B62|nr:CPBP family intramembrane glutamic endopeptidase [Pseudactinotalea terrae]
MSEPTIARDRADPWGPSRPRRPLGLRDLALGVVLVVLAQALVAGIVLWQASSGTNGSQALASSAIVVGGLALLWAAFAGAPLLAARRTGRQLGEIIGWVRPSVAALAWGAGLGLALRGASLAGGWLAGALGMPTGQNVSWLVQVDSAAVLLSLLLGTVLIGPVLEETFFRGLVLHSALGSRRVPQRARAAVAVLLSSVLFGLAHLTTAEGAGLFVVGQTGLLGAILAVLALRRGLAASVTAHVVFNTTGVLMLMVSYA